MNTHIGISGNHITIEDICRLSKREASLELSKDKNFFNRINDGYKFLEELLQREGKIYGVTTGYGDSVSRGVPVELVDQLPINLTRFHGCGLGQNFNLEESRAVVAARIVSLARGFSGVRYELLQQLETLLQHDIIPVIPQEGSVGASGDLTPLSYVAAVLIGERTVHYNGEIRPTSDVFSELKITPLVLRPKEGLAIMNGTAVMTAIACLLYKRTEHLVNLCTRTTSFVSLAMKGNKDHFDEYLFVAKPHLGPQRIAREIRLDVAKQDDEKQPHILQDRYSIRCAPHIIGVLADALPHFREVIENELNSANDNPLIDPVRKKLMHGGHFYGGHIAYVMDSMKVLIANLADLMDRQLALLVDVKFSNGLTSNLSLASSDRASLNHGFKAVQIGVSAWTAEALKNCMPASVFSRSTECHNQDKVSMGTIAARDCMRVLQLTEQVQAAHLLACVQAIVVREHVEGKKIQLGKSAAEFLDAVLAEFEPVTEDRPLENDLRRFVNYIQEQYFNVSWNESRKVTPTAQENLELSDIS
jgi:histidine ammonia-lyase